MKLAANESPRRSVIRTLFAAVATAGASFLGVAQAQSGSTPRTATGATGVPDRQAGPKTSGKQRVGGAIRAGNLVFVGGIGGWYPERRSDGPGDVRRQSSAALDIMKERLEGAGTSMANVLKLHVSLVDPENNWEGMNEVFNQYFPEPRPVRSFCGSTAFRRPGVLLQVDCIAYVE